MHVTAPTETASQPEPIQGAKLPSPAWNPYSECPFKLQVVVEVNINPNAVVSDYQATSSLGETDLWAAEAEGGADIGDSERGPLQSCCLLVAYLRLIQGD